MTTIAGYALLCETPRLGEIIEYLHSGLKPADLEDVRQAYLRGHFGPIREKCSGFLPPLPLEYIRAGGQDNYLFFYDLDGHTASRMIVEKLRHGELDASEIEPLIDLLSGADPINRKVWARTTWLSLKSLLGESPVEPLLALRHLITGSTTISNTECALRLKNVMGQVLNTGTFRDHDGSLESHADIIRSNQSYCQSLLMIDLKDAIRDVGTDNYPSYVGMAASALFANFIRGLGLSDTQISALIFMFSQEKSAGEAYDIAHQNPASGAHHVAQMLEPSLKDITRAVNKMQKLYISVGLMEAMSDEAKTQMLEHDQAKVVMFRLKGDRCYLDGIKDKSKLDDLFGADVGL